MAVVIKRYSFANSFVLKRGRFSTIYSTNDKKII